MSRVLEEDAQWLQRARAGDAESAYSPASSAMSLKTPAQATVRYDYQGGVMTPPPVIQPFQKSVLQAQSRLNHQVKSSQKAPEVKQVQVPGADKKKMQREDEDEKAVEPRAVKGKKKMQRRDADEDSEQPPVAKKGKKKVECEDGDEESVEPRWAVKGKKKMQRRDEDEDSEEPPFCKKGKKKMQSEVEDKESVEPRRAVKGKKRPDEDEDSEEPPLSKKGKKKMQREDEDEEAVGPRRVKEDRAQPRVAKAKKVAKPDAKPKKPRAPPNGPLNEIMSEFMKAAKEDGFSWKEACEMWKDSDERKFVLASLSEAERKRRRYE